MTYPDPKVADFVAQHFVPVKLDIRTATDAAKRLKVSWTPTLVLRDAEGEERHRFVGFLPPAEFVAHLTLGLGKSDFERGNFPAAAERFAAVVRGCPACEAAPEAQYFLGVAKYKQTKDVAPLKEEWKRLTEKYASSDWAKKASFVFQK